MTWFEALILGILQGLTEFLPVSSSGHLTIAQEMLNLSTSAADNLQFIVTVHAATVMSTIVILWKEIAYLFRGTFCTKAWNDEKSYVLKIIISMIPVGIVGVFFKDEVEAIFGQGILVVGCCLLLTALLLTFAYYAKPRQKENISDRDAFIIGLSQAVAVLPGLSRSGTTIATGLLLGNKKESIGHRAVAPRDRVRLGVPGRVLRLQVHDKPGNAGETNLLRHLLRRGRGGLHRVRTGVTI